MLARADNQSSYLTDLTPPQWVKEFRSTFAAGDSLPLLVLGLKRDLRSEDDPNGIIYPQEAYGLAQQIRADKYMECSAVTGELLTEAFDDICKTAVETTTPLGGQSEGGCTAM
jgi:Ras family protein A